MTPLKIYLCRQNHIIIGDVFEEIKKCNVLIKGPMVTPRAGEPWPNLVSANSLLRRGLELFAAVRPIKIPDKNIDWTFFRENTEGAYAVGSKGVHVTDDLAMDFVVATTEGCERISRLAYDYAKRNGKNRVSVVSKANVIKTTDGKFLNIAKKIGEEYPEITTDEWYIDILTAKLIDEKRRRDFRVFILPNLYGDIISDLCAGLVGGLGFAPSANIGDSTRIYEAVHGSAPDIAGQDKANPSAILMAFAMMLNDLGETDKAAKLNAAILAQVEEGKVVTADIGGTAGTKEFTQAIISRLAE